MRGTHRWAVLLLVWAWSVAARGGQAHDRDAAATPDVGEPVGVLDADGDGFTDAEEGAAEGSGGRDSDGDGTPDYLDPDSDGNGIADRSEGGGDNDGDGIEDYRDTDGDGVNDLAEQRLRSDPTDPASVPPSDSLIVFDMSSWEATRPESEVVQITLEGVPAGSGITFRLVDFATDDVDATEFVAGVRAVTTPTGCDMLATVDTDGDGDHDAFVSASNGDSICFEVVPEASVPDAFHCCTRMHAARLDVVVTGGGATIASRLLLFTIAADFCGKV